MEFRKLENKYVVRLDKGEEVAATLKDFCHREKIILGSVLGIGALKHIELRYFDPETKKYYDKKFEDSHEAAPLSGNVSTMAGETYLHLHASLGDYNFNTVTGHLKSAIVSATLEVIIDSANGKVDRKLSEEIGLNLLELK